MIADVAQVLRVTDSSKTFSEYRISFVYWSQQSVDVRKSMKEKFTQSFTKGC